MFVVQPYLCRPTVTVLSLLLDPIPAAQVSHDSGRLVEETAIEVLWTREICVEVIDTALTPSVGRVER